MRTTGYATRLFIDGRQLGGNGTFLDHHAGDAEAVADARRFFEGEGFEVESIDLASLPRWEGTEPVPTMIVKLKTKK